MATGNATSFLWRWDWRFWMWWTVASMLGAGIILLVAKLGNGVSNVMLGALVLGTGGGVAGLGQWIVLHRTVPVPKWGVLLWTAGAILIALVPFAAALYLIDAPDSDQAIIRGGYGVVAAMVGMVVGIVQCFALQDSVRWYGLWIIVSALAGAIGWPLGLYLVGLVWGLNYGAVCGCVGDWVLSGAVLAWLTRYSPPRESSTTG